MNKRELNKHLQLIDPNLELTHLGLTESGYSIKIIKKDLEGTIILARSAVIQHQPSLKSFLKELEDAVKK